MLAEKSDKIFRLLQMHERLSRGEHLIKSNTISEFGIPAKTFQRDIDSLRSYYFEQGVGELIYDRRENCYRLIERPDQLTKQEIFAICKVLIESRAFNKDEFNTIITKLLRQCETDSGKEVQSLIANEWFHYLPLQHGKPLVELLWRLAESVVQQKVIRFCYKRLDNTVRQHEVKPVGIMFSEFYFYLIGFMADDSKKFPTVFRVDRMNSLEKLEQRFRVPYSERFSEAEFRKRVQFMYAGELERIKFKYVGLSIEAVLDRLPTAQVLSHDESGWIVEAEVFGKGIEMWIRSQGEYIQILKNS